MTPACRTLIVRKLKGLEDIIPYTCVHWHMGEKGSWHRLGIVSLHDPYLTTAKAGALRPLARAYPAKMSRWIRYMRT